MLKLLEKESIWNFYFIYFNLHPIASLCIDSFIKFPFCDSTNKLNPLTFTGLTDNALWTKTREINAGTAD